MASNTLEKNVKRNEKWQITKLFSHLCQEDPSTNLMSKKLSKWTNYQYRTVYSLRMLDGVNLVF